MVPDESVLERYRRHLTSAVVQHFAALPALRELERGAMLGCWCVERDAILVGAGRPEPDLPCHGDVIFTVWLALELLDWDVPRVSFQDDFDGANRAWAELYEHAFGERMLWGEANEAGKCSLPSSAATRGAA